MSAGQEQLSLFPSIDERAVRQAVANELKAYKALRVAAQNRKEQQDRGIQHILGFGYDKGSILPEKERCNFSDCNGTRYYLSALFYVKKPDKK